MDLVQSLLGNSELVSKLTDQVGLTRDEADRFVPAATEATVSQLKGGDLDIGALLGGDGIGSLLSKIDVGRLASVVGLGREKTSSALSAFVPALLQLVQSDAGQLETLQALIGGEGDLLSKAAGGLGRLFKN